MTRQIQQPGSPIGSKHIGRFCLLLLLGAFFGIIVGGGVYFMAFGLLHRYHRFNYIAMDTIYLICGTIGIVAFLAALVFVVYHGFSVIRFDEDATNLEDSDKHA